MTVVRRISRTFGKLPSSASTAATHSPPGRPSTSSRSALSRPPRRKSSSARITRAPALPAVSAAISPAGPPPITSRSQNPKAFSHLSGSRSPDSAPSPAARRITGSYTFSQNPLGHMKVL